MKELLQKNIFTLVVATILLVLIPVTLAFFKYQQETRSRALGETVSFALSPSSATKIIGDEFDVVVSVQTNGAVVKGADFQLQMDTTILQYVSFTPGTGLSDSLIKTFDPSTGVLRIVSVDTTDNKTSQGTLPLGTLRLRVKAGGRGSVTFSPQNMFVVALRNENNIATINNAVGIYTGERRQDAPRTVGFSFSPQTATQAVNTPFDVTLTLNAGRNFISGLNIVVKYNKDVLRLVQFQPTNAFGVELIKSIDENTGTLRYAAVDTQNAKTETIMLGTLKFVGKAAGTSDVTLQDMEVAGLGISTLLTPNITPGSYTIGN